MDLLDWTNIVAANGFQLVYKLVKLAERLPVAGDEKKRLVMLQILDCLKSGNKLAIQIKIIQSKGLLDNMIDHVALCNQGKRKCEAASKISPVYLVKSR